MSNTDKGLAISPYKALSLYHTPTRPRSELGRRILPDEDDFTTATNYCWQTKVEDCRDSSD